MSEPFGVYLHIPFCAAKCDYCAFATWTDRHHLIDTYLRALTADIARAVDDGMPPATSVFVGGGTPSLVPGADLAEVLTGRSRSRVAPRSPSSATPTTSPSSSSPSTPRRVSIG